MAQAAFEDTMSEEAAPSVSFIISRNADPFTLALRNGDDLDNDELSQLNQASSSASSSVGSSSTAVFSSREPSIVTKRTSYGTGYPVHDYKGEGKAYATYAASLSATHGSDSEAEVEHDEECPIDLRYAGAWSFGPQAHDQCLRKSEHARIRASKITLSTALPHRLKKPPIVLLQPTQDAACTLPSQEQDFTAALPQTNTDSKHPRKRTFDQHYMLLGLLGLVVLTVLLGALKIYYTDRGDITSIKLTFLAVTSLVAFETIVTTLVVGQTLLEASLLGLFPLIVGYMFLTVA